MSPGHGSELRSEILKIRHPGSLRACTGETGIRVTAIRGLDTSFRGPDLTFFPWVSSFQLCYSIYLLVTPVSWLWFSPLGWWLLKSPSSAMTFLQNFSPRCLSVIPLTWDSKKPSSFPPISYQSCLFPSFHVWFSILSLSCLSNVDNFHHSCCESHCSIGTANVYWDLFRNQTRC